ncbi:MAG: hypothetical protein J6A46_01895, partial [Clostridia bacterium]|nr:hypothetical protein [Clostridia bacterium]
MVNPGWFSVYDGIMQSMFYLSLTGKSKMTSMGALVALLCAIVALATVFILQGIGLYAMAKKANVKRAYLAFVPFGYLLLVEELA